MQAQASAAAEGIALSEVFRALDAHSGRGEDVRLGDVLDLVGARAHGTAIFLLAIPDALPLPVPSVSGILGLPLLLISLHLAVHGEGSRLPAPLRDRRVPGRWLGMLADHLIVPLERAERMTRPRLAVFVAPERAIGAICVALALLLFLPIPLMNTPPSLGLALLGWGLMQRDGAFVIAGLALSAALLVAGILAFDIVADWLRARSRP